MDILLFSLNGVGPVILVILFGFFLRRINLLDLVVVEKINKLCFLVLIPILLFDSIRSIDVIREFDLGLVAYSLLCIFAVYVLSILIVPHFIKNRVQCGAFIHGTFRGNFLQFGFPLTLKLFGSTGGAYAAMLLPFIVPIYNVLAVVLLTLFSVDREGEDPKKLNVKGILSEIAKNPLVIGAAIGFLFSLFQIPLPVVLDTALSDIEVITPGLLLLLLGAQITPIRFDGQLLLASLATMFRLVLVPLVVVGGAILMGFTGPKLGTLFVLFCVPTSISSHIMAINMGSDHELAGKIVVFTTVSAGFTLFVGVSLLRYFALI